MGYHVRFLFSIENNSPTLTGDSVWNVTVGVDNTYTVVISDVDGDATVLYVITNPLPGGATFDNTTGVLVWNPSDMTPVEFT